jgi:hypothetical protein
MNYVWSMTDAQAKLQVCFRDQQLLLKPMQHTGLQIWKADTILYPCGVALDSERPAPVIYTVCPLEVQTAVIASCEHRWPERAMGLERGGLKGRLGG